MMWRWCCRVAWAAGVVASQSVAGVVVSPSVAGALLFQSVAATPARAQQSVARTQIPHTLCVRDAATGAGIARAQLTIVRASGKKLSQVLGAPCGAVTLSRDTESPEQPAGDQGDSVVVRRLGYEPRRYVPVRGQLAGDTIFVALVPIAVALPVSITQAPVGADDALQARNAVSISVDSARALGAHSTGSLVALLPYTFPRSARGEVTLSLRGARREQVAVTLDGVPLTDPSTGLADLADVPLALLQSVTVSPGSDPIASGPGAAGGVLSLRSGNQSVAMVRAASFGDVAAEGAWSTSVGASLLRIGAAHRAADNNFAFVNSSGSTGTELIERRVNNDVTRSSVMAQWQASRVQLTALASRADVGMVGPVNVRANDQDRSQTRRLFMRAAGQTGSSLVSASLRGFGLRYRDPARASFDANANALAADADIRRSVAGVALHAGVGADRLRASANVAQDRARGFASAATAGAFGVNPVDGSETLSWTLGARLDAIEQNGVLPSFSLGLNSSRQRPVVVGARVAQAVRVPTLYDLYFSSPQRLTVRALDVERIVLDAEVHARWQSRTNDNRSASLESALITRITDNAIVWFPGNFGWSPANVGTERVTGVELRGTLARGPADINAWSTVYNAELTAGGLRIPTPYVPRHAGGATARLAHGPLQLSGTTRWFGTRPYTAGPRDDAFLLPAVALVDLAFTASHALNGTVIALTFALENATDQPWQSVRGFPSPGRAWSVALVFRPTTSQ